MPQVEVSAPSCPTRPAGARVFCDALMADNLDLG